MGPARRGRPDTIGGDPDMPTALLIRRLRPDRNWDAIIAVVVALALFGAWKLIPVMARFVAVP
jgi:hypothetical protein